MDIRIGNDIKVSIALSKFGSINASDIKHMSCTFYKEEDSEESQFPIFHHSSQYTVHGCGIPVYNVSPSNMDYYYTDPYDCGQVVYKQYVAPCKIEGTNLIAVFPAEAQFESGTYSCHFDIKVYEEGWDVDNLHSYRQSYGDIMNITESTSSGQTGSVTLEPDNDSTLDTYISSYTEDELNTINGNYSSIISSVDGYQLASIPNSTIKLNIIGTGKHIVVLSKYNNLSICFNAFEFPMNMYKLDNGYYMYVSVYTYSNYYISLTLERKETSNTVIETNPYINSSSKDTEFDDTDEDNTETTTTNNTYANNILKLTGSYSSNDIKINGKINTNTLEL